MPPLSAIEINWIELAVYIGAMIGTVFLTFNGDVFGRKYTLVTLIIPQGVILHSNPNFLHSKSNFDAKKK